MAGRYPGDDDRPTIDLGPRAPTGEGEGDGDTEGGFAQDLGDEPGATRTVAPPDPVHSHATQQLPPRGRAPTQDSSPSSQIAQSGHTKMSTASSPAETMRADEIARTQIFLKVAILTCIAGILIALVAGGDPIAFRVVMAGCIVTTIGCMWMYQMTRDTVAWGPRRIVGPALVIALGAYGGVYYWGIASPVAAMIVYGIYFFSLGAHVRTITAIYILVACVHAAVGLAVVFGVIADRGIVNMTHLRVTDQLSLLVVIEFLYFITFYTARVSARVTLDAVSRLDKAVRNVAQREAMLAEARAELDRALVVGGPGRYTDLVVGGFRLGVLIGRGGMGEVYEAHGVSDQREAAVKLLHPGTLGEATHVARFVREAQTAARLDCPHVVRVLEVGTTTGEVPFLAMERLRGHDLAHQLRRQRRLQLPQAEALVSQISIGLEAAREAGIVHRDLKPHNVFFAELSGERLWKILDFGVSKSGGTGTLTKGHVIGTPAYMAPEQARGEDVDHRADVYSLTAILYRSITGHPAFTGKDVPTTLYDVVYRVPTQPSILAPLSGDLDRVLAIGLAKKPADRFATAAELASWLSAAIKEGLTLDQRRRADELIAKAPWGTRLAGS